MKSAWLLVAAPAAVLIACFSGDKPTPTDLPCDVATALSTCQACHGAPPTESAPFTLQSYADLTQPSPQYPDQTVAQRVVARMQDPNFPMPPNPIALSPQSDIDTIQAWIDSGYAVPAGTQTCTPPPAPDGTDPFATDPVCTNGTYNTQFANVSMFPGEACVSCHVKNGGPKLAFAGTVYPTAHEPDDCKGALITGAQVLVTDSSQNTYTANVQGNGDFYMYAPPKIGGITLSPPYTVRLTYQGRERDMTGLVTPPTDGDCNSCHTESGTNGAPGRILLP